MPTQFKAKDASGREIIVESIITCEEENHTVIQAFISHIFKTSKAIHSSYSLIHFHIMGSTATFYLSAHFPKSENFTVLTIELPEDKMNLPLSVTHFGGKKNNEVDNDLVMTNKTIKLLLQEPAGLKYLQKKLTDACNEFKREIDDIWLLSQEPTFATIGNWIDNDPEVQSIKKKHASYVKILQNKIKKMHQEILILKQTLPRFTQKDEPSPFEIESFKLLIDIKYQELLQLEKMHEYFSEQLDLLLFDSLRKVVNEKIKSLENSKESAKNHHRFFLVEKIQKQKDIFLQSRNTKPLSIMVTIPETAEEEMQEISLSM